MGNAVASTSSRPAVSTRSTLAPTSWRSRTWSTARCGRVSIPWSTPSFTNRSPTTRCQPSGPMNRCSSPSHSRPSGTRSPIGCSPPPATAIRWRAMSFWRAARSRGTTRSAPSLAAGWRSRPDIEPRRRRWRHDHRRGRNVFRYGRGGSTGRSLHQVHRLQHGVPRRALDGDLSRPEVPRSRIRTLPLTAGGRGHGRARSLLRLQALRSHLPVAGLDPGIHPASTKQRRRGEGPDAPRLGPGTHAPAQPVWKHDRAARQPRKSKPAGPLGHGAGAGDPPQAPPAALSVADLRALVHAPWPPARLPPRLGGEGRGGGPTPHGGLLLWLLGQLQRA